MRRTVRERQLRSSLQRCLLLQEERIMGMAVVIYEKGAPDNFVWAEITSLRASLGFLKLFAS